ncbi:MAG: hypothetical protein PHW74_02605 [Desulfobacca sp.]|nr:hypothetical protein [Desulfobacca sp.]
MIPQLKMFKIMGVGLLALVLLGAPGAVAQSAPRADHAQLYQRAVSLLDKAQEKLDGNFTAEAKAMAKEANSLFATLQKETPGEMLSQDLSPQEMEQEALNRKLAADSYAQGDQLMQSAQQKEAQSKALEQQGREDESVQKLSQAKREYDQAHKMYVKSQIYNLRNQQIAYSFLKK